MNLQEIEEFLHREGLDILVSSLPLDPPLKPGGDVSVREMHPDMSEADLDYVMEKYRALGGRMRRDQSLAG